MKRSLVLIPIAASLAGLVIAAPHTQSAAKPARVVASVVSGPTPVVRVDDELALLRASRSRTIPVLIIKPATKPKLVHRLVKHVHKAVIPAPVVHHHYTVHLTAPVESSSGCGSNWQNTLDPDERWIYGRESGMDASPSDVNPSSGARGLGQLLNSTYADLGITPDWVPCDEIAAARAYMRGRYGSWPAARAFWESHNWW